MRVVQVGFITVAIYQGGYTKGLSCYAADPHKMEREMVKLVLNNSGGGSSEPSLLAHHTEEYHRVDRVFRRVIKAAKLLLAHELKVAQDAQAAYALMTIAQREAQAEAAIINMSGVDGIGTGIGNGDVAYLKAAIARLEGNWECIVSLNDQVNAFVTGICPRKVFVFTGLLVQLQPTDDELAVILAHELSHVIGGHVEEDTGTWLLGVELVLLTLVDPIGIWTFLFDYYLDMGRKMLNASYSRLNEEEADRYGILVSSFACYDVKKGATIMDKLALMDTRCCTNYLDTHPATFERVGKIGEMCKFVTTDKQHLHLLRTSTDCAAQYYQDLIHSGASFFVDTLINGNRPKTAGGANANNKEKKEKEKDEKQS